MVNPRAALRLVVVVEQVHTHTTLAEEVMQVQVRSRA